MSRVSSLVLAVLLGSLLVGCTTVGEDLEPTGEVLSTVESTVPPVWTDEELAVIKAVQDYLQVWTEVSHDLENSDWSRIHDVAENPIAIHIMAHWSNMWENGWHLEGRPVFTTDRVTIGGYDDLGQRYHVYGCYSIEDGYLINELGELPDDRGIERGTAIYEVLRDPDDNYRVLDDSESEDAPC